MSTREEIIAWLRAPDGEQWTRARISARLRVHMPGDGVFASVFEQPGTGCGYRPGDPISLSRDPTLLYEPDRIPKNLPSPA